MSKRSRKPAKPLTGTQRLIRQIAKLERQQKGVEHQLLLLRLDVEGARGDVQAQSGYLARMVEVERKLLRGIVHLHDRPCRIPTLQEQQARAFMAKPLSRVPWTPTLVEQQARELSKQFWRRTPA